MVIKEQLDILRLDLSRKSPKTRSLYTSIARKFITESGDFSRQGMLKFMNNTGYCDNSLRTTHYILKRLCKALGKPFPLDKDDLLPPPDEEAMYTPTMSKENVHKLIAYWKNYPGEYVTSLVFISTVFGLRSVELTNVIVGSHSIIVHVAKRKAKVTREHTIPEDKMKYLAGYHPSSEMTVRYSFWKACRKAGIARQREENWHSLRRTLDTICIDSGISTILVKRFMRWAKDRRDMASVYYHKDFQEVNNEMLVIHPLLKLWG